MSARISLDATLEHAFSDRLVFVLGGSAGLRGEKMTFFGKWRFDKTQGLSFELTRRDGRLSRMVFGGYARFKSGLAAQVELAVSHGEALGVTVDLSRRMGGAEVFLRLLKNSDGRAVFLGYGRRW
jgi:hypothetical protein